MSRREKRVRVSGGEPVNEGSLALKRGYEPAEEEEELPTNKLYSGRLSIVPQAQEEQESERPSGHPAELSRSRRPDALLTGRLDEDDIPLPAQPSGMGQHTAAARIVPTVGSRVRTGLRRSTLLALLSVAAGSTLAGGGYVLATSPWAANIINGSPSTPAVVSAPAPSQGSTGSQSPSQQAPAASAQQSGAKDDQLGTVASPAAGSTGGYEIQRDWGIAQYKQGNYAKAIELLEGYVEINGDDALAYDDLGLSYMAITGKAHSLEDAEMAFRTAASLQSGWAAPYQGLAESLLRRGYYTDAIAPAEKATQLQPTLADAWLTLGRAYQGAGRTTDADNAFAQAEKVK